MKTSQVKIYQMDLFKSVQLCTRVGPWVCSLLFVSQLVTYQAVLANDGGVGTMTIDGKLIPSALFNYYQQQDLRNLKVCDPTAKKEKIIDFVVAALQTEGNAPTIINDLQRALPENSDENALEDILKEKLRTLSRAESDYLKLLNFYILERDLYDEYQKRVRDKDPNITNVTIVRVLEIKQPNGAGWDKKLAELATSIKQGTSFEEAEARYPSRYKVENQIERWVILDSLPHRINSKNVKAGDIYGVEKILTGQSYYDPMVKIYEVKHLSQVRLSDEIFSVNLPRLPRFRYLRSYLMAKAHERKKHLLMSELWSNYSIVEQGKEIQRVGMYKPCE